MHTQILTEGYEAWQLNLAGLSLLGWRVRVTTVCDKEMGKAVDELIDLFLPSVLGIWLSSPSGLTTIYP